ncbi:uncharacterized protein LOC110761015 isoform X2 [Prunus avium]|uniref:Uncharacterized protein LOC110761015 isoform X2 n=1 Tax=Prunus avium TaxID=42229 RepID=A0A6P5SZJ1_PRUAV|nr:uncharacterized protein LOC110761015 isoform X2 [Prunus avium]
MDMLSYSVNSLRLTNLKFNDTKSTRVSQVVRLQMNEDDTQRVLNGCKTRGIKLCAALVAAGLMAVDKYRLENQKKYGVVTLTDCRSNLHPALSHKHFGSYHSAILNTHTKEEKPYGSWPTKPTRPLQALRGTTSTSQTWLTLTF